MQRRVLAALLGLTLLYAHGDLAAAGLPSDVLVPPQKIPLKFSHREHLRRKLACDFCHDHVESSTSAADRLLPGEQTCRACHKIDRANPEKVATPPARCAACHQVAPPPDKVKGVGESAKVDGGGSPDAGAAAAWLPLPVDVPEAQLKFNHKVHAARAIPCVRCHGSMDEVSLASRAQIPRMATCLECHKSSISLKESPKEAFAKRNAARCQTCHLTRYDGKLETSFRSGKLTPSGALRGDAHNMAFAREHRSVAREDESYCLSCHRRDACLSCHNGVTRPLSLHGNDYVSIHAVDARKATLDCNACHRRQNSCLACHERTGVTDRATADSPNSVTRNGKRFHPPYERWVAAPKTPDHHAWQAERNLRTCVSCHREDTCLECHSARRGGSELFHVSPHPAGFAGSRACQALSSRNGRVCLKCHAPADQNLNCR